MSGVGQTMAVDSTAVLLQAASLLLSYPAADTTADLDLIASALAEQPPSRPRRALERFLAWWTGLDTDEREQSYVATFDLDPDVSLYLSEEQPRTSRTRGAELLELRRAYIAAGVDVTWRELPDFLPLMLEAAAADPACRPLLAARRDALESLKGHLERRQSPFALVVGARLEEVRP
jgi:nitrate reductase delta subunit